MNPQEKVHEFQKYMFEFKRIFGRSIAPYADMFCGFDLTKFLKDLACPDNVSGFDYIGWCFKKEGTDLLNKLFDI